MGNTFGSVSALDLSRDPNTYNDDESKRPGGKIRVRDMAKVDENGNTALMNAINNSKHSLCPLGHSLLQYPEKCGLDVVNNQGKTALTLALYMELDSLALKMLETPEYCNLNYVNPDGSTVFHMACNGGPEEAALIIWDNFDHELLKRLDSEWPTTLAFACSSGMEKVANLLLDNPDLCNVNGVSEKRNDTAFFSACNERKGKMEDVAMRIITYPGFNLDQLGIVDGFYRRTPLIAVCEHKLEDIALKILEHPDKCNMGYSYTGTSFTSYSNEPRDTALMWACRNKMERAALKMLEHPDKCNLGHRSSTKYKKGTTALQLAIDNDMTTVADKIAEHVDVINSLSLTDAQKAAIEKYVVKKRNDTESKQ